MHSRRLALLAATLLAGCSSSQPAEMPDAAGPDAPPPFAEAAHAAVPQMVKMTGDVLATPKIVPIFFTGDSAMQSTVETFLQQLAASSYWTATTSEYGVGTLTIEPTIVSTEAPPTSDTALDTWIKGHFNGQNGWPSAPDPQAIYSVFLPAGATFTTSFGNACEAFGAYHDEATTATNQSVVYALMPRCAGMDAQGTQDELTESASHEWIEAATDPRVETTPAYGNVDNDHYVWAYIPGAEVGDMCEYVDAAYAPLVGNFMVQRTWSNAAATAGHDPCVPAVAPETKPYFGIAPVLGDSETLPDLYSMGNITTKGIQITQGAGKTIEVDLFSDVQTEPWTVEAIDAAEFMGSQPELSFQWDKTTGTNGDKLHLTILRVRNGTDMPGSEFVLMSKDATGTTVAEWWGFVAN